MVNKCGKNEREWDKKGQQHINGLLVRMLVFHAVCLIGAACPASQLNSTSSCFPGGGSVLFMCRCFLAFQRQKEKQNKVVWAI